MGATGVVHVIQIRRVTLVAIVAAVVVSIALPPVTHHHIRRQSLGTKKPG